MKEYVQYSKVQIFKNTSAGEGVRAWLLKALMKYSKGVDAVRRTMDVQMKAITVM